MEAEMNDSNEINQLIVEAVLGLPQMNGKKLIRLAITGSRSKGLASSSSDYDVKAVILHSATDYVLQRITPSKAFVTSIVLQREEVEVEGTLVDYLTMQKYALTVNQSAYDALYGLTIYGATTTESKKLEELFRQSYTPATLTKSFVGLLRAERRKADKEKDKQGGINVKLVANMIYYASMVHLLSKTHQDPLPQDAFELLKLLTTTIDEELREKIHTLYQQRKANKSQTDFDMDPFISFIQETDDIQIPTEPKRNSQEDKDELQQKADDILLAMVFSSSEPQLLFVTMHTFECVGHRISFDILMIH